MRVAFDSQIFCAQQFGGISRYFASLANEMHASGQVHPRIVAPLHINGYLEQLPPSIVTGRRVGAGRLSKALARGVSIAGGTLLQELFRSDIAHRTYYYPWPRRSRTARNVLTVYDMIHEKYPGDFSPNDPIPRWKRDAVAAADHVICISENTRRDLLALHDVSPSKVSVTYLGYDRLPAAAPGSTAAASRTRLVGADRPYLLYVGSRGGYKNFTGLARAFAASSWLRANFLLLCFGGGAFTGAEQALFAELGIADAVRQTGGDDAALADSYRFAELFVYPSLYEGFGIPPLEAMSLDCPVACSLSSSLPEVVGDAAVGFAPEDTDAMRVAMESALQDRAVRDQLIAKGKLRREMFSWERCARETVAIYQEISKP